MLKSRESYFAAEFLDSKICILLAFQGLHQFIWWCLCEAYNKKAYENSWTGMQNGLQRQGKSHTRMVKACLQLSFPGFRLSSGALSQKYDGPRQPEVENSKLGIAAF